MKKIFLMILIIGSILFIPLHSVSALETDLEVYTTMTSSYNNVSYERQVATFYNGVGAPKYLNDFANELIGRKIIFFNFHFRFNFILRFEHREWYFNHNINENGNSYSQISYMIIEYPSIGNMIEFWFYDYRGIMIANTSTQPSSDRLLNSYVQFITNDLDDYAFSEGYELGKDEGFALGVASGEGTYQSVFEIITTGIFAPIIAIFNLEVLPNITVGMLILIPLIFGLIAFIIGGKKNG